MFEADGILYRYNSGMVLFNSIRIQSSVGEEVFYNHTSNLPQSASIQPNLKVVCAENYYGPKCHQYCNSNCTCDPGYTGEFCHEIDDCLNVTCDGNRLCMDEKNNYTCVCSPVYTGSNCEININEIDSESKESTRHNRAQCVNGINNFTCNCVPGFTGDLCQTNIDECAGVDCSGNGQCVDDINNFTCNCVQGLQEIYARLTWMTAMKSTVVEMEFAWIASTHSHALVSKVLQEMYARLTFMTVLESTAVV